VAFDEGQKSDLEPVVTLYHDKRVDLRIVVGISMCVESAVMYPLQVVGKGNLVVRGTENILLDDLVNVLVWKNAIVLRIVNEGTWESGI
jgi:hypothetical protein